VKHRLILKSKTQSARIKSNEIVHNSKIPNIQLVQITDGFKLVTEQISYDQHIWVNKLQGLKLTQRLGTAKSMDNIPQK